MGLILLGTEYNKTMYTLINHEAKFHSWQTVVNLGNTKNQCMLPSPWATPFLSSRQRSGWPWHPTVRFFVLCFEGCLRMYMWFRVGIFEIACVYIMYIYSVNIGMPCVCKKYICVCKIIQNCMQVLQVQRKPTKLVLQAISQSSWVDWPFRFFSANGNLLRSNFLIGMPILTLRCSMMSSSTHPDQSQVIIQQTQVESFLQRAHVYFPRLLDILPWNRHQKHQQFPITFCLWNLPQLISQPVQLIMLLIGWNTNGNKHNLGSGSASIQVHFA